MTSPFSENTGTQSCIQQLHEHWVILLIRVIRKLWYPNKPQWPKCVSFTLQNSVCWIYWIAVELIIYFRFVYVLSSLYCNEIESYIICIFSFFKLVPLKEIKLINFLNLSFNFFCPINKPPTKLHFLIILFKLKAINFH